ncbi:DNA-binding response regulator, OmpR family, contains REC and winged-helix (wHTH) domain [Cognatiyoonia koreensis]|uniref:DNA-binding response regulator, OmpR family, contains REC and winged-helix (WHTH) domain n=1 Tax=Cognatiyoonia koreensis TaxID=364200 RepID=A0A1I0QHK9_9RHOB|nr:response regulator [Cognatiyoonia koreensis]SEW26625.1 DNA-binding response regulator, OmpR family, contains REC and winged-helix (wHTH) domain [Cognatiyoonia koreensis]
MSDQTILVVDDDSKIRTLLRNVFEAEGFQLREAADSKQTLAALDAENISLVTLDLHLGQEDGLDLARLIRQRSAVPIIMVTGKDDVIDRVVGLEMGADDYVTKPFHVREVVARARSVLRRSSQKEAQPIDPIPELHAGGQESALQYHFDGLTAVPGRMEVLDRDGIDCGLTSGDFKLLNVFLERPMRVLSRDQLMDLTGGHAWSPLDRTIDNQIARLRKKIERDVSQPKIIKTVRGVGYTFAQPVKTAQLSDTSAKSA